MSNTQLIFKQLQDVSTRRSFSTACKQLTKTFGSKRPAVVWIIVCIAHQWISLLVSTQLWASTASCVCLTTLVTLLQCVHWYVHTYGVILGTLVHTYGVILGTLVHMYVRMGSSWTCSKCTVVVVCRMVTETLIRYYLMLWTSHQPVITATG